MQTVKLDGIVIIPNINVAVNTVWVLPPGQVYTLINLEAYMHPSWPESELINYTYFIMLLAEGYIATNYEIKWIDHEFMARFWGSPSSSKEAILKETIKEFLIVRKENPEMFECYNSSGPARFGEKHRLK